jgi:hypothetical protein
VVVRKENLKKEICGKSTTKACAVFILHTEDMLRCAATWCLCVCVVDGGSAWRVLLSQGGAAWLGVGVAKKFSEVFVLWECASRKPF